MANKTIQEEFIEVNHNPINPNAIKPPLFGGYAAFKFPFDLEKNYAQNQPFYLKKEEIKVYSKEEFVDQLSNLEKGEIAYLGGKLIEFKKVVKNVKFPAILITESVLNGLRREHPDDSTIKNGYWKPQPKKFKNLTENVFGADLTWTI